MKTLSKIAQRSHERFIKERIAVQLDATKGKRPSGRVADDDEARDYLNDFVKTFSEITLTPTERRLRDRLNKDHRRGGSRRNRMKQTNHFKVKAERERELKKERARKSKKNAFKQHALKLSA